MGWTYLLLVALLLRIAVAQESNPFTVQVPDIVLNTVFTIYWEPTTEGTVTITIVELDDDRFEIGDLAVLGENIPNSGSLTTAFSGSVSSPILCGIKIVSDSSDPPSVTHSNVFKLSGTTSEEDDDADTTHSVTVTTYFNAPTERPPIPTSSQPQNSDSSTAGAPITDITTGSLPSETSASSSTGLSVGAAAGIGVGATLGALILLGIGGFFWWRARKRPFGPETSAFASPLEAVESKSTKRASELQGTGVIPAEIQGTPRAELE